MGGIFKYELDKMSSSVHSVPLCDLSILVNQRPMGNILIWKTGPKGERTPREGIRVWESIIRQSADFTLLIIGNPGALVTFFNHIPGLLFPKKIM